MADTKVSAMTGISSGFAAGDKFYYIDGDAASKSITLENLLVALIEQTNCSSSDTLAEDSDSYIATQSAIKTYVDTQVATYATRWIPAGSMIPTDTNGAEAGTYENATYDVMVDYYAFADDADKHIVFNTVAPEGWDLAGLKAKFYWMGEVGASYTNDVCWSIEAATFGDSDGFNATDYGTAQTKVDDFDTDNDLQVSAATSTIVPGGTEVLNDLLSFKVMRDVSGDTGTDDAWLIGVLLQFKVDTSVSAW